MWRKLLLHRPIPVEARELVDATFEELSHALIRGEPVKLRSFETFVSRASIDIVLRVAGPRRSSEPRAAWGSG